ncbi:hypothetical protein BDU57DRAFT_520185 [Ampelomyces quisqualis]|uniref:Uncharacterized protein n=1 Tax=Ampelomyces quisqualis TaxID=50730 RepID=A0A6A5QJC3_AMPQU|nr:hypothetical protein BDU57DRAFT_520185 [Ampelomyces quisqualis]
MLWTRVQLGWEMGIGFGLSWFGIAAARDASWRNTCCGNVSCANSRDMLHVTMHIRSCVMLYADRCAILDSL